MKLGTVMHSVLQPLYYIEFFSAFFFLAKFSALFREGHMMHGEKINQSMKGLRQSAYTTVCEKYLNLTI